MRTHWEWLVLWPAAIVVLFGLLQIFILPRDFLRHFGYGPSTIPVFETINNNKQYLRIASTLRGANPLGAYMLVPISLLTVQLLGPKRRLRQAIFLAACFVVLFYSFSRSAWIGALLTMGVVTLVTLRSNKVRKIGLLAICLLLIIGAGAFAALRNNVRFENFIFHRRIPALKQPLTKGTL
jgi:hypothetical protein